MKNTINPRRPGKSLQVLCLEDSLADAELMHENLAETGFAAIMDVVSTKHDFLENLADSHYDLVLVDHTLPDYDAFAAIDDTRRLVPDVPLIVVSGTIGEDTAVEMLKRGATDYVFKDRLNRLGFAVQRALDSARFVAEARAAEEAGTESTAYSRCLRRRSTTPS